MGLKFYLKLVRTKVNDSSRLKRDTDGGSVTIRSFRDGLKELHTSANLESMTMSLILIHRINGFFCSLKWPYRIARIHLKNLL